MAGGWRGCGVPLGAADTCASAEELSGEDTEPGPPACQYPFDELPAVAGRPGKQPRVHDRTMARRREIDDLADGGGVFVSSEGMCAWCDLAGPRGHRGSPEVADRD